MNYNDILVLQLTEVVEDDRGHYDCVNSKNKSNILLSYHLTVMPNSRYSSKRELNGACMDTHMSFT